MIRQFIIRWFIFVFILFFLVQTQLTARDNAHTPVYLDPTQPIEKRVNDLVSRMTLEEKIGQINIMQKRSLDKDERRAFVRGTHFERVGPAGGVFALTILLGTDTRKQVEFINELQTIAIEETRLGIPLIVVEEGTHGFRTPRGTIFPEGLAIGGTWNMDLVRELYAVAAREGRSVGVHGLCTLVIEPVRDPRMGRNQEAYSEDPFLTARIAREIVAGMQGDDISANDKLIAFLCHFPAQSEPVSGLERGEMDMSERKLREVFLPPWVAGIKEMGALGIMATYPTILGVPVHASDWILTDILREELDFEGIVVSEGGGLGTLLYTHMVETQKQAGELAIKAGVDASITLEEGYLKPMYENVQEGRVSVKTLDRAVKRILRTKYKLGLFDNPFADASIAQKTVHTRAHVDLALQVAREGMVLLKNQNNLLPLDKNVKSIAVIGPKANDERYQLGDYVAAPGTAGTAGCQTEVVQEVVTVLEGIQNAVSENTQVSFVKGVDVLGTETNEIDRAKKSAQSADVAVVVVGEMGRGETYDVASLDLPGLQNQLVQAVYETGTPTIVVLINGRPLSIRWIEKKIPAVLEAWLCGERGGEAVADILFGDYNPNGKLPVTVPQHVGQLPMYYNYMPSKAYRQERGYVDMSIEPLFPFGHGLSYTNFEYSDLVISPQEIRPSGHVKVEMTLKNIGNRKGAETVQLYINDIISSVVTPVQELRGFHKVWLNPGETKKVEFILKPEHLTLLNACMKTVVEPGTFEVMIGSSSKNIRLKGSFDVRE